jgi:hypothetical protein
MKQPEGFVVKGKKELVCELKRSLYGINKSPRMWYQKFDMYILSLGFLRIKDDDCVYSMEEGYHFIYVSLYFNDMFVVGSNMDVIKEVKMQLSSKLDMKDLGKMNFILRMEIKRYQEVRNIWLNYKKYIEIILKRFSTCKIAKLVKVPIPHGRKANY